MYLLTDLIIILVFLTGAAVLGFLIGRRSTRGSVEQWRTRWQTQQQALNDAEERLQRAATRQKALTHELTEVRTHLSQQGVEVSDLSRKPAAVEVVASPTQRTPSAMTQPARPAVRRTTTRSEPRRGSSIQEETLNRIRSRAHHIDLERIGTAPEGRRDDLKRIEGVGIFAEKKLNALGICTLAQMSRLNDSDQQKVNQAIELSVGRIAHDGWVQQAKQLLSEG